MLRIAICDDDNYICAQVEKILLKLKHKIEKRVDVDVFYTGESLIEFLIDGAYFDIIFLDIELHSLSGVEVGRKIRDELKNESTQIVYISGRDSYAMELFDIRPLNFLIKPLKAEKINEVVKKAISLANKSNQFFEYKANYNTIKIPVKDILYFESSGKKVRMTMQNEAHEFYSKLTDVENQLNNQNFIFIHKSYLVNHLYVIEHRYEFVKMSNETVLPISQQRRKHVRARILHYNKKE